MQSILQYWKTCGIPAAEGILAHFIKKSKGTIYLKGVNIALYPFSLWSFYSATHHQKKHPIHG